MATRLGPKTALAVLAVVLLLGTAGSAVLTYAADGPGYDETEDFVTVSQNTGDDTLLWTYTSPANVYEHRTLGINVIVYGDPERTHGYLTQVGRGDWNETTEEYEDVDPVEQPSVVNATDTRWREAGGSTRYVYVRTSDATGRWMTESYQVHDGDYLGSRHHVRAYDAPEGSGNWTAMQAHREHWDWFQLRHIVDSVEESQSYVEQEFMDRVFVDDVWRVYLGTTHGSDADGWVTIVDLAGDDRPSPFLDGAGSPPHTIASDRAAPPEESTSPPVALAVLPVIALTAPVVRRLDRMRRRIDLLEGIDATVYQRLRSLLLAAGIIAVVLGVRFGGIGLERALSLPPKAIAAFLYPLLFAGLPIVTYLLARQLERPFAFAGASLGFLVAIMLEYTFLGVTALPLDVLVHRGALAVALGFVAAGASRPERRDPSARSHIQMGVLLWLVAVLLPVLRFTPLPV